MKTQPFLLLAPLLLCLCGIACVSATAKKCCAGPLSPKVAAYVADRAVEFDQIPAERKAALQQLAHYVQSRVQSGQETRLLFICTHNSRRSHLAQIWAQAAACHYRIPKVKTYSGGTSSTAFNPRTIAALERAGFSIEKTGEGGLNPIYKVTYASQEEPLIAFSKVFTQPPNPNRDFCAVMTCSDADKTCPVVPGADLRVAIPYEDPKAFDGTPREGEMYDERSRQICREMLYLFSTIKMHE